MFLGGHWRAQQIEDIGGRGALEDTAFAVGEVLESLLSRVASVAGGTNTAKSLVMAAHVHKNVVSDDCSRRS